MSMGAQLISESHFLEKQGIKDLFPAQKSIVRLELELSAQTLEHLIGKGDLIFQVGIFHLLMAPYSLSFFMISPNCSQSSFTMASLSIMQLQGDLQNVPPSRVLYHDFFEFNYITFRNF